MCIRDSGYTAEETPDEPDLTLVQCLSAAGCRVIAEGRYNTPAQAAEAMRCGAWAVTVGSAITISCFLRGVLEYTTAIHGIIRLFFNSGCKDRNYFRVNRRCV